ncbi:MAG TPA: phosphoribosylformylglycinamidine cyclo-ligase [Thermoleophilaceae bacterium]|nr:phosphoribosylformylglycinamidine cyclo-ligase [Thermoleophilaceae bacterium]
MADRGAYAEAGVDASEAHGALSGLVGILSEIDTGKPSRSVLKSGHYAAVLRLDDRTGLAFCTDGVGSKVIVAEQAGRYDTVGIDCIAMNVNDVICVGAEPIALVDYIAVEEAQPDMLRDIAVGLRKGAEQAGIEIPGGELAQLPELIKGHPSPNGFDLCASCIGVVPLDRMITGEMIDVGDAIIGIPSSGVHSNGLTLARNALSDLKEAPPELGGRTVADELLEPTVIYVRAILELIASDVDVRGLAHITGDGFLNLTRLHAPVGYRIDSPLPVPPVFTLIAERGSVDQAELWEVFNMGCGFCVVVPSAHADAAVELLRRRHAGTSVIGSVTEQAGVVELPQAGLAGRKGEGFRPA